MRTGKLENQKDHVLALRMVEALSFIVKFTCVETMRQTSAEMERLHGKEKAWDFSWGDISKHVKDVSTIVQEAGTLCSDISVDLPANPLLVGKTIGLPSVVAPTGCSAGHGLEGEGNPPKKARLSSHPTPPLPIKANPSEDNSMDEVEVKDIDQEDDVSLADDSVSSTSMSSQDLQAFEDELLETQAVAYGTLLVSGKGNTTKVHLISPADDESSDPTWLSAWFRVKAPPRIRIPRSGASFQSPPEEAVPKVQP